MPKKELDLISLEGPHGYSEVTHPAYSNGPPGGSRGQFVQYQRR